MPPTTAIKCDATAQRILEAVRSVLGPTDEPILLHAPSIPNRSRMYVTDCLDSGWVSSSGTYVKQLEEAFCTFTGFRHAVATVNGTAALQIALNLVGVGPGDEVLAPSLTFVATANAIRHQGAEPHFIDVSPESLGMSPAALQTRLEEVGSRSSKGLFNKQTGKRIAAICPMHCFGMPCDMDSIIKIARDFSLPVAEDAAESLGSFYKSTHTGTHGDIAAFSLNGNKIITSGGGGIIATNDDQLARRAHHITTTAKIPHRWEFVHDVTAWNYRMPNINAALALGQQEEISDYLTQKRRLYEAYKAAFSQLNDVAVLTNPPESQSNHWLVAIKLQKPSLATRDASLSLLNRANYQSRPLWRPMHLLDMHTASPRGDLTTTENLHQQVICLPSSAFLAERLQYTP